MLDFSRFKLVAALGNPGQEYAGTYHNAGQLALDHLLLEAHFKNMEARWSYHKEQNVIFVKPLTYMNESGAAIRSAADYFKVAPEDILVMHDDSDLALGECKLQFGRGAAGHNGVASAIRDLGTQDFWRLRIGVRKEPGKAGDFVLRPMSESDREAIYGAISGTQMNESENKNPSASSLT
jgi:peptidyl-tRNA hydrolase, PTH1 family